jgi:hypothetical protein
LKTGSRKLSNSSRKFPARLDGTEVDPFSIGMDWQERDYDVAYKIRKQIRAGYGWLKVLDKLSNAERRRLNRMQIESDGLS